MNKQRALMLGITSGVVTAGGIITAVLLYQMVLTRVQGQRSSSENLSWKSMNNLSAVVSVLGLVYIVPGVIGFIAAFFQNKCMYITTCIFTLISLLIMALVVLVAGFALIVLIFHNGNISAHCINEEGMCQCRSNFHDSSSSYEETPFKMCAYYEKFVALTTALLVFIILTWIAVLFECVIAFYYSCRSKATTGTVVMTPQQQPFLQPGPTMAPQAYVQGYVQGYPLQDYGQGYPPPSYDQDQALPLKV